MRGRFLPSFFYTLLKNFLHPKMGVPVIFILHPKKRVYPFLAFLLHWNSLLIRIKPSFGYNKKLCPIKGVFYTLLWKYFYTFLRVFDFFVHSFFLFFFSEKNPHLCTRVIQSRNEKELMKSHSMTIYQQFHLFVRTQT